MATYGGSRAKDIISGISGVLTADDEVMLLNGLLALGYDPAKVQAFSDRDPSRRFLGDAVTRALNSGISEDEIRKAIAFDQVARTEHDPVKRVQGLAQALGLDMGKVTEAANRNGGTPDAWINAVNQVGLPARVAGSQARTGSDTALQTFNAYARSQQATFIGKGDTRQAPGSTGGGVPAGTPYVYRGDIKLPGAGTPGAPGATAAAATGRAGGAGGRGGGGGGGAAAVDTTPKLAPGASPDEAMAFIREHYGYGAWIAEQKPVWDVLVAAAKDGHWSDARLSGALMATDFFKTHTGKTVAWLNTKANDPAEANAKIDQTLNTVISKAQTLGMDLDPGRARQIAEDSNMFGWDDTQLTRAVGHEYHYNPTMAQKGVAKQLRDTARLYGVPMTDAGLDDWGRRVGAGDSSADDFRTTMINQAKSLFPTLAPDLDRGSTVKDIFDPYAKLAANTLGVDESTIDLLDPKWQRPLQSSDGKNPTRMSTFDWQRTLRTDSAYGFDTTDNARQEAADFAHRLRVGFGLA
jgi:hypothetical protein